jgi:hypothetical protein
MIQFRSFLLISVIALLLVGATRSGHDSAKFATASNSPKGRLYGVD